MIKRIFNFKHIAVYLVVILVTYTATSIYLRPFERAVKAIAYTYGDSGDMVVEIQRRLKAWGYYNGSLDGQYGYNTFTAVMHFQANNGLTPDGITGTGTLDALGINAGQYAAGAAAGTSTGTATASTTVQSTNNQDVNLLARLINGEARGEPFEGQVAVGAVIMNRTRDPRFPKTIAGVIYQPGAFTAIVDGQIGAKLQPDSIRAARDALNGWDPSGGAVFYYNPAKTTNAWIWSRPVIKVIGNHRFCK